MNPPMRSLKGRSTLPLPAPICGRVSGGAVIGNGVGDGISDGIGDVVSEGVSNDVGDGDSWSVNVGGWNLSGLGIWYLGLGGRGSYTPAFILQLGYQ